MGHIFEPFFTTKGAGRATGLRDRDRLRHRWSQNRGRVRAAKRDGGGAEFEILSRGAGVGAAPDGAGNAAAPFPSGTESILLVEDDGAILTLGREVLTELGYLVYASAVGPGRAPACSRSASRRSRSWSPTS